MPKISLIQVKGNSYICNGFLSIGVFVIGSKAILIDSGGDESCAKDVHAALNEQGYQPVALITTHCHPDHCGGNSYFQKKIPTIAVYAAYNEKFFIEDPQQAPRCFCQGAVPFKGLQNKYIGPQHHSKITHVITSYQDQELLIEGAVLRIITLPGHTQGMIGVITPDNVLYCGDALFGDETLKKHPVLLYTDIPTALQTCTKLEHLSVDACVLYHGGIVYDLSERAVIHRENMLDRKKAIRNIIAQETCSIDIITQRIMQQYAIPNSLIAFTLTQTAVRAYVAALEQEGVVTLEVQQGLLQIVCASN